MRNLPVNHRGGKQPFQFSLLAMLVVTAICCVIFASPLPAIACVVSLAIFVLGMVCARGEGLHRMVGRQVCLLFGTIFMILGTMAFVISLGFLVVAIIVEQG